MAIQASDFSGTDIDQAFSARFAAELARTPTIVRMLNRNWESDARNNENVIIDNLELERDGAGASSIVVADRPEAQFKRDFQDPTEFNVNQQSWKIDQGGENSFKMYDKDIRRTRRGRGRINAGVAKLQSNAILDREDNIVAYMGALTTYATDAPVAADLPNNDNTGRNGNAGSIHAVTIGSGNQALTPNGVPRSGGATDVFFSGLEDLRLRLQDTNIIGGELIAGDLGAPVLLVRPEVIRGFIHMLRTEKITAEALNISLYQSMAAFGTALEQDRLMDLNIVVSQALPKPAGPTSGFTSYLFTPQAITYADDIPNFWSQSPRSSGGQNDGPFFSYHQVFSYGRKLVNASQIIKVTFASAAPSGYVGNDVEEQEEAPKAKGKK